MKGAISFQIHAVKLRRIFIYNICFWLTFPKGKVSCFLAFLFWLRNKIMALQKHWQFLRIINQGARNLRYNEKLHKYRVSWVRYGTVQVIWQASMWNIVLESLLSLLLLQCLQAAIVFELFRTRNKMRMYAKITAIIDIVMIPPSPAIITSRISQHISGSKKYVPRQLHPIRIVSRTVTVNFNLKSDIMSL